MCQCIHQAGPSGLHDFIVSPKCLAVASGINGCFKNRSQILALCACFIVNNFQKDITIRMFRMFRLECFWKIIFKDFGSISLGVNEYSKYPLL